jgi:acetyl esterase/lipase
MTISLRSRFWRTILRTTFKNQKFSITEHRINGVKNSKFMGGIPKTMLAEKINIDEIHSEWLVPAGASHEKVILYLHGGGYVTGCIEDHRMLCGLLATATGVKVLIPEYRLAPENPFPAALDDALKIYQWLLAQGTSSANIIIAGDSAGGGLSVATVLALKDKNVSLPAAVLCLSPWVDLTLKNQSHITKVKAEAFILTDVSGFSALTGGLAYSILMLPTVARTAEEVLKLVPKDLRDAAIALGSSRARVIMKIVLPTARTGILTAVILGVARVIGETAPLLLTTSNTNGTNLNPFVDAVSTIPVYIFQFLGSGYPTAINRSWGAAFVLLTTVAILFAIARIVERSTKKG